MTDLEREAWAAFKGDITSWPMVIAHIRIILRPIADKVREMRRNVLRS